MIVDNTNPSLEDRAELIKIGREYGARVIGLHFKSTREQSLNRNSQRHGRARVPYVAIADTLKRFVVPTLSEGFAELYEVICTGQTGCTASHEFLKEDPDLPIEEITRHHFDFGLPS